jgi:hypothetical protein
VHDSASIEFKADEHEELDVAGSVEPSSRSLLHWPMTFDEFGDAEEPLPHVGRLGADSALR